MMSDALENNDKVMLFIEWMIFKKKLVIHLLGPWNKNCIFWYLKLFIKAIKAVSVAKIN